MICPLSELNRITNQTETNPYEGTIMSCPWFYDGDSFWVVFAKRPDQYEVRAVDEM